MDCEEKLSMLTEDDFVALFCSFGAEPRWVTSAGKRAIQILGLCHKGENHSALFDPDTLRVMCFSECNGAMLLHTWVKRTLDLNSPFEAKEKIMDWTLDQKIDFSDRVSRRTDFEYKERPYDPNKSVEMVEGMPQEALDELYARFEKDSMRDVLEITEWAEKDGIEWRWLDFFDVRYDRLTDSIILPHHNIDGDIVGLYQRSFRKLRREIKKEHPEMPYETLVQFPRAKYVPLLRHSERWMEQEKTSWSFPNSRNLYGLHLAAHHIAQENVAIIFEGGKSVMLAHQYGYPFAVATHTFGAHLNHITMLLNCMDKARPREIILAFDKQYEEESGQAWALYEQKTRALAMKIRSGAPDVTVTRLRDTENNLAFKDAPIDKGQKVFKYLLDNRDDLLELHAPAKKLNKINRIQREEGDEAAALAFLDSQKGWV